jgi:translation initiation factor eIF-2B subunit beta
MLNVKEDI